MSGYEAQLVDVLDEEYIAIQKVGYEMQMLWNELARHINIANVKETANKVNEWSKRVEGEYQKIGFLVGVDTTPIYVDQPPTISIFDRVTPTEFDHERKGYEVRKSRDKGGR